MIEPSTPSNLLGASIVALASMVVGQQFGLLAAVGFASLLGSLLGAMEVPTSSRLHVARYIVLYTFLGVFASSALATVVEWQVPGLRSADIVLILAVLVGWVGPRWGALAKQLIGLWSMLRGVAK